MNAIELASYIRSYHLKRYGVEINKLKLQNLLYLCQREAYACLGVALITGTSFLAWKHGPVLEEVRNYKGKLLEVKDADWTVNQKCVDKVLENYCGYDAWELSLKTRAMTGWKNAHEKDFPDNPNPIQIEEEDIMADAQRIALERYYHDIIVKEIYAGKQVQ